MLTLSLMRHAKSNWGDLDLDDFDRALSSRGIKAAALMGSAINREGLAPALILCSGAVRTRATLALMLPELKGAHPHVVFDDRLYLALPETMLDIAVKAGRSYGHVMVLAHNPGLHALALSLIGRGDHKARSDLAAKFPTAALAMIAFDATSWRDVRPGKGALTHFITPRGLE